MTYRFLLFDLDGTLCDPLQGFLGAMNYALTGHGLDPLDALQARQFIGPPLEHSFRTIVGANHQRQIDTLLASYRQHYGETGYLQTALYPGVADVLSTLASHNVEMGVCTSKRSDFARAILDEFGLLDYFRFVSGGDSKREKWQELAELVKDGRVPEGSIMIGDRCYDLVAANRSKLDAAGVLWGYGSREELAAHHPRFVFERPDQILSLCGL